jgi:hypothetical protein
MRIAGFLVVLCLAVATSGCKSKGDAASAPDPAAVKAQQELVARRDALLAKRQELQSDRDKLDAQIKDAQAKGGDTTDLVKKRADLDTQIDSQTSDLINTLSSKIDSAIQASGDKSTQVAAREAEVASREKGYATREEKIAERERQIAQREAALAQREKDTCSGGGAPVIIQAPKGGNYGRKDVTELLTKAKTTMSKKGVLTSDLPGPAQGLESDATKAMNENDWSKAYVYAVQLVQHVDAIQINRAFIQAKMNRVSNAVKGGKVDDAQLQSALTDVMQKYNDGDFAAANKRLNALAAMIR